MREMPATDIRDPGRIESALTGQQSRSNTWENLQLLTAILTRSKYKSPRIGSHWPIQHSDCSWELASAMEQHIYCQDASDSTQELQSSD